jgi:hypothetical protein
LRCRAALLAQAITHKLKQGAQTLFGTRARMLDTSLQSTHARTTLCGPIRYKIWTRASSVGGDGREESNRSVDSKNQKQVEFSHRPLKFRISPVNEAT